MININFVNRILIIADNASGPGPRPSALVISGSPRFSTPIKFFKPSNSRADFLADVLANLFGDFGINTSSNLVIDPVPSPTLGLFL